MKEEDPRGRDRIAASRVSGYKGDMQRNVTVHLCLAVQRRLVDERSGPQTVCSIWLKSGEAR